MHAMHLLDDVVRNDGEWDSVRPAVAEALLQCPDLFSGKSEIEIHIPFGGRYAEQQELSYACFDVGVDLGQ